MGEKGSKMTQDSLLMADLLFEKLNGIDGITIKKMFGGHGLFHDGKMFGMVDSKGQCYLKANDTNLSDFENNGSKRHGKMPYFSIPDKILNEPLKIIEWAEKSIAASK